MCEIVLLSITIEQRTNRSGTTLLDETEAEAQENYYDVKTYKTHEMKSCVNIYIFLLQINMFPRLKKFTESEGIEYIHDLLDENDTQLLEDGNRVKTWRFNNLNQPLTIAVMQKITRDIEMRVKIIQSFSCNIHKGGVQRIGNPRITLESKSKHL